MPNWTNNWLMTIRQIEFAMDNGYPVLTVVEKEDGFSQIMEPDPENMIDQESYQVMLTHR